ncbi:hypothetical protein PHLCEN_2v3117 [Hermanssonia centrifuga]|uniref:Uncharacterized protein n=1 Tax=Hermanssonia centrifuga TaxID=98765 RepID=A0A2R6R3W8_9APHY|nr:hypothetical protein PHLCEN_2v3117 [Hermanssonia centrifuga]
MSPSKSPVKNIKVKVPRHNSQRIGPVLTAQVQALARKKKLRVDVGQTAYDPASILAQATDSASDWNSRLMTARAERGPQWDIGTQQFLVDEGSDLYYDPTPLREYEKEGRSAEENERNDRASMPPPNSLPNPDSPQLRRHPSHALQAPSMPYSPRHAPQFSQGMSSPFGGMQPVPAAQFYGNGDMGMRMGGMSGMHMDGMGMGNMGGMGIGMGSPEMRRGLMRRGPMGMDDGFGGMH